MTDEDFACGARMGSLALGATFPIFQYLFMPATWGVVPHGAEIGYVFQAEWLKGKDDRDLAAQMLAMWVAFAATGKPTSTSVEDIDAVTWPAQMPTMPPKRTAAEQALQRGRCRGLLYLPRDRGAWIPGRSRLGHHHCPQGAV